MIKYIPVVSCLLLSYSVMPGALSSGVVRPDIPDTLAKDTFAIEQVIIDKRVDALEKLAIKKAYHHEIYLEGDDKNMITLPTTGGLAINIQKLYNHFSGRGKGARRLQQTFEREYEDDLANAIWNPLVEEYTSLRGDSLEKFNLYAKPTYIFLTAGSPYEQVAYLMEKVRNYRDSAALIHKRFSLTY